METTTSTSLKRVHEVMRGPGGLRVEIDSNEVYPDDPGMGTPVMVYMQKDGDAEASATIHCALGEGEVEWYKLTNGQYQWLLDVNKKADDLLRPFWRSAS